MIKTFLLIGLTLVFMMVDNGLCFSKERKFIRIIANTNQKTQQDTLSYSYLINKVKEKVGTVAPNWTLVDLNGNSFASKNLIGKPILLEFWSTGCGACIKVAKDISKIDSSFRTKGLVVIPIESDKVFDEEKVRSFTEQRGIYKNTLVNGFAVSKDFNQKAYPTFFLIDKTGKIVFAHIGWLYGDTKDKLISEIEKITN